MRRLFLFASIIILLSFGISGYADDVVESTAPQDNSIKRVLCAIGEDYDFYVHMAMKGITDDEVDKALYSQECIAYIRQELEALPEEGDVSANWDVWKWHVDKIEKFIENLFSSGNNYNSSQNNNSNNNGYNGNNNDGYNNMMPPPMPYSNNNGWGQYPPMPPNPHHRYGRNNYNNWSGGRCNCNCDNCSNCMYK